MLNSITIHGRLTRDPELRHTGSGVPVCSLTVAVDRDFQKEEKITDFFDIVAWRGLGEMIARYFHKGKEIVVHGSMQSRKWQDKDGNNRVAWELVADGVDFCGSKSDNSNAAFVPPPAPAENGSNPDSDVSEIDIIKSDDDLPF